MNIILIHTLDDLRVIREASCYFSDQESNFEKEIEHNMWCISFSESALKTITVTNIVQFFDTFLQQKLREIKLINSVYQATFYAWFDKQALQLRFNILSGKVTALPFSCQVRKIDSLQSIIQDRTTEILNTMHKGNEMEILDTEDFRRDEDDEEAEVFVLNVYVKLLK